MKKKISNWMTLVLLTFGLLACSSPEEKAADYLEAASQLFDKGELVKSEIEYRNALQINQNLPDAWYGLAKIHERNQEWEKVYGALVRIRDTNPNYVDGRIMLAQILLASNQMDQALDDAKYILELVPEDARSHSLMAAVQFRLGNNDASLYSAKRALTLDPGNNEAILVKIRVYITQKKYDEALDIITATLALKSDNVSLYLMRIQVYEELGDTAAIEEVYKALILESPQNLTFKHALVRHYLQLGDVDQAENLLEQIVEDNPRSIEEKLGLVSFKSKYRSVDDSIDLLKTFVEQNSNEYQFKFALAELYLSYENIDEAKELFLNIIGDDGVQPNGLEARNQLALIYLQSGMVKEAKELVDEVLTNDKNNENALLLQAGFKIDDAKFDDAIVDLRTVLRDNPTSIRALGLMGQAYTSSGSAELAMESYNKAFNINPSTPLIANALANNLMRSNNPKQADEVLQQSIRTGNRSVEAVRLLTQVKLMLGEFDQAEKLAQQLKTIEGEESFSEQVLGLVYQERQQQVESIKAFQRAHKLAPGSAQPVVALVRTYVKNNQIDEAKVFLQAIIAENKNNVTAYLLLGQLSLRMNDTPGAIKYFEQVLQLDPKLNQGYRSLSSIYVRDNKFKDAERILLDGLTELPGNEVLTMNLASVYEGQDEFDKAIELYETLLQQSPDLIVAKNNLASILTDQREDQASHDRARQIAAEFKDSSLPQFRDTYAWAAVRSGINLEEAVVILEDIVKENDQIDLYAYHLGDAYRRKGDAEKAKVYLNRAIYLAQPGSGVAKNAKASLQQMN